MVALAAPARSSKVGTMGRRIAFQRTVPMNITARSVATFRRFIQMHSRPIMHWSIAFSLYCVLIMGSLIAWPSRVTFAILWLSAAGALLVSVRPRLARWILRGEVANWVRALQYGAAAFGVFCVLVLGFFVADTGWPLLLVWTGASLSMLTAIFLSLYHDMLRGVRIEGPRWLRALVFILLLLAACAFPFYAMILFVGPQPGG